MSEFVAKLCKRQCALQLSLHVFCHSFSCLSQYESLRNRGWLKWCYHLYSWPVWFSNSSIFVWCVASAWSPIVSKSSVLCFGWPLCLCSWKLKNNVKMAKAGSGHAMKWFTSFFFSVSSVGWFGRQACTAVIYTKWLAKVISTVLFY